MFSSTGRRARPTNWRPRSANWRGEGWRLQMIDNRGVKVWPDGTRRTFCTDSFRCRFMAEGRTEMAQIVALLGSVADAGIEIADDRKSLRTFDGQAGLHPGAGAIAMADRPAGSGHHGQQVGLGSDAPGRRDADAFRRAARVPGAFGASHAASRRPNTSARRKRAGIEVVIAAAGGAAHLAGVCAAHTILPVLGVPMESASLKGWIRCFPRCRCRPGSGGHAGDRCPGARNAALLAIAILANSRPGFARETAAVSRRSRARRYCVKPWSRPKPAYGLDCPKRISSACAMAARTSSAWAASRYFPRGQKKPFRPSPRRRGTTCMCTWGTLWLTRCSRPRTIPPRPAPVRERRTAGARG